MKPLEGIPGFDYGEPHLTAPATDCMKQARSLDTFAREAGRRGKIMAEIAVRDRDAALDIVQDSLLAWVDRYADKPESEWPALFYTVLNSRIMDWKRKQARRSKWRVWLRPADDEPEEDPLQSYPDPVDANPAILLERAADITRLQAALQALPLRQQQAFLLRAWEGLDTADTAAVMGCGENSVKTHYARALAALRLHLTATGDAA